MISTEFLVMLGGDHSVTFANVRAFAKKHKNIGMIHIDTHADCAPQGLCGFKYDHGAHIRRIMELGCLKGKNYTLIGPRGYWPGPDLIQMDGRSGFSMVYHVRCGRVRN